MSKLSRLEAFLKSGATATPRQITGMFGLRNPTAAVNSLRNQGVCVYTNAVTLKSGKQTVKYRVGAPTKGIIKLAQANGYFN